MSSKKILVLQTWGMGDLLMTVPAILGLKKNSSHRVSIAVSSKLSIDVLKLFDLSDEAVVIDRSGGRLSYAFRFAELRKSGFDAAIVATELSPLVGGVMRAVLRVPSVVGGAWYHPLGMFTQWVRLDPLEHRVKANERIFRLVDPQLEIAETRAEITAGAQNDARLRLQELGWRGEKIVAVHLGSARNQTYKRLPVGPVVRIVRKLHAIEKECFVLFLVGPEEKDVKQELEYQLTGLEQSGIIGEQSLEVIAGVLALSKVLLSGDTGIGHLGSMAGTRVVTIAGPTNIARTRPWGSEHRVLDCLGESRLYRRSSCHPIRSLTAIPEDEILAELHACLLA